MDELAQKIVEVLKFNEQNLNIMKNLLILISLFLSQNLVGQEKEFTVSGKITGLASESMTIVYKNKVGKTIRDSIRVSNESFSYTAKIGEMTMMTIWPNVERVVKRTSGGYFPAKSSLMQFVAFPGAKVHFSGKITDFVDAYPGGDKVNKDLARLNKSINPLMNKSVNLQIQIANKVIMDSLKINKARRSMGKLNNKVVNIKKKFILENSNSAIAAWLLADMMLRKQVSNETATTLFANLNSNDLKSDQFYLEVAERVEGIRSTAVGKTVPEIISTNTYDGKRFDLTSLRGKYVVLDFWGTWCGPCISGMPRLQDYLTKYNDKMEIVGVAQESDDGSRWRKFLDTNKPYQWHQVLSRKDEDYILKFNVAGFPTKIIIDPNGKIVERFVGETDAIYDKLDEIFKK